jgi:hypothetical protein
VPPSGYEPGIQPRPMDRLKRPQPHIPKHRKTSRFGTATLAPSRWAVHHRRSACPAPRADHPACPQQRADHRGPRQRADHRGPQEWAVHPAARPVTEGRLPAPTGGPHTNHRNEDQPSDGPVAASAASCVAIRQQLSWQIQASFSWSWSLSLSAARTELRLNSMMESRGEEGNRRVSSRGLESASQLSLERWGSLGSCWPAGSSETTNRLRRRWCQLQQLILHQVP